MARNLRLGLAVLAMGAVFPKAHARAMPFADVPPVAAAVPHIVLDRSNPEDQSTSSGPVKEIRLFFSGAPLMRGASVRVVTSGRQLMRTSPPAADPADPTQVFVQIDPALPAGSYVVQWRCIADDGHVMRGDFSFEVAAE